MAELRRVAVVTGGTRGIGAAITERVASDGAHVVATFATDKESAFDLQSRLGDRGLSVSVHQVDVRAPEDCQRLVAEVLDERGRVDYLVNNAGIDHHARLQETPIEVWDDVISTDLSGAFYLTRLAVDPMVAQGFGRIVSISSIAAVKGSSWQSAYAAAKAGLLGFTRSVAREVATKGVTVNVVMPGPTATGMDSDVDRDFFDKVVKAAVPMRRRVEAEEVAHAVAFLLDDRSGAVTGVVLPVDGGASM